VKRREFIAGLGGAAAWPLAAHAQQPAMPVIGFLDGREPDSLRERLRGMRQGLKDTGYVEGENVAIVYRYAENQSERLPELAAELVQRRVSVIIASGGPAITFAAKAATTAIPIVFLISSDPVGLGLVASVARPGGNLTGVNFLNRDLTSKRLELLRAMMPAATRLALLMNPKGPWAESMLQDGELAARSLGLQVRVLKASTSAEIDAAFASIAADRPDVLLTGEDPLYNTRRLQLSLLAMRHGIPAAFSGREYAEAGGLMSYGSDITEAYRQVGVYAGRILKGAKPADLPVVQLDKFELTINAVTARALGVTVPQSMLVAADHVIE
jgi:putative ABC transport system substrate-binding protein